MQGVGPERRKEPYLAMAGKHPFKGERLPAEFGWLRRYCFGAGPAVRPERIAGVTRPREKTFPPAPCRQDGGLTTVGFLGLGPGAG